MRFQNIFLALLIGWLVLIPVVHGEEARKPNVVLFLIDDLNHFGVGAYGAVSVKSLQGFFDDTPIHTTNIDRLAREGVRCDQAYVYPLCENTRVALMTGMHNGRNFMAPKALHESQITFGDVFQRAGYATGIFGKWKQTRGTPDAPADTYIFRFGWDEFLCFDVTNTARGWNRHIDPTLFRNGEEIVYTDLSPVDPETGRRWYGPDLVNRAALDFIDRHKDEPFFLYYPMLLVHDEHTPTPDSQPPSVYDEFDTRTKTEFGHLKGDDRRYFPDMIAYTDKMIGKVIDKLDELGLRENTLVIVLGDNGAKACFSFTLADGTERRGGKGHNRDRGEHVPLVFSWPGTIPASPDSDIRSYAGLFDVTDIYPTLLDACGIAVPNADKIDGISAWPQLLDRTDQPHREAIYRWYNANRPITDLEKKVEFAFTADFKRYAPHGPFKDGRFFDLRDDLDETAGGQVLKIGWDNYYYAGLDIHHLTPEQQEAYDMLGKVLERHSYIPVERLGIAGAFDSLKVGQTVELACKVVPANATRNNVIWESSDPSVVSIDKFGQATAHKPGRVTIRVFSWDDAYPVANGKAPAYRRDGIQDAIELTVVPE